MRLLLLVLAAVALVMASDDHHVVGQFRSMGSRRCDWGAVWTAAGWGDVYVALNTLLDRSIDSVPSWLSGGDIILHSDPYILRYYNHTSGEEDDDDALSNGPSVSLCLGREHQVFQESNGGIVYPSSVGASTDGQTLWVCGTISYIDGGQPFGTQDFGNPQLYQIDLTNANWSVNAQQVSPPVVNEAGVDCQEFHVLTGGRLIVHGNDDSWYFRKADGTWVQMIPPASSFGLVNPYFQEGPGEPGQTDIFALSYYDLKTATLLPTNEVQKWTNAATGPSSWQSFVSSSTYPGDEIADYAVGKSRTGADVLFIVFTDSSNNNGNDIWRPYYVYASMFGEAPKRVADGFRFTSSGYPPSNDEVEDVEDLYIYWDQVQSAVIIGGIDGVVYSPRENIYQDDQYAYHDYARAIHTEARLTWSGEGHPADDTSARWLQAYGGGFTSVPTIRITRPDATLLIWDGDSNWCFDVSTGPAAFYDEEAQTWVPAIGMEGLPQFDVDPSGITKGMQGVFAIAKGDNGFFFGGHFRTAQEGSIDANSLLWVDEDGNIQPLGSGLDSGVRITPDIADDDRYLMFPNTWQPRVPGFVYALLYHDEHLYVGGRFDIAGSIDASCIAVFHDGEWSNMGGGISITTLWGDPAEVYSMVEYDGKIIVAGHFDRVGRNQLTSNIAAWDPEKHVWEPLNSGLDGTVRKVVVWKGFLVAGGAFRSASGKATGSIALWDGEAWWHVAEELDNDEEVPCHLESTCTLTGDVYDMYPTEDALWYVYEDGDIGVLHEDVGVFVNIDLARFYVDLGEHQYAFAHSHNHVDDSFEIYNMEDDFDALDSREHALFEMTSLNVRSTGRGNGASSTVWSTWPATNSAGDLSINVLLLGLAVVAVLLV